MWLYFRIMQEFRRRDYLHFLAGTLTSASLACSRNASDKTNNMRNDGAVSGNERKRVTNSIVRARESGPYALFEPLSGSYVSVRDMTSAVNAEGVPPELVRVFQAH